ncbi:MAG: HU family DNA-binding protein [Deltaproteobacteria bacterium]|nr:HU family DNA-binding protein [Deltaproteobacteria bacterium]
MNKKELVAKLAKKTGISQAKAQEVVNALFDTKAGEGIIAVELDAGRKVSIPGFGTFFTRTVKDREVSNPAEPGQKMAIGPRTYPRFRAGKNLKERVIR